MLVSSPVLTLIGYKPIIHSLYFILHKAFLLFFLTIQDFMGFEDGPKNHVMKNFMF